MGLRTAARAALGSVLCVFVALASANGQNAPPNLKEVQVADGSFSLGDPIPPWVETVAIPEAGEIKPIIVRLADTQWLVGDTPVVHIHRAVMVNDAASLTSAGQLSIQFNPQYQRLQLHAIHVLRADKSEDRTTSSTIRFLQRETGLERGVYSGIVTVSILVNDLRVGDTIELAYSLSGQNPVFGGKFVSSVVWDQGYPTLLRHMVFTYPAARKINWRLIGDTRSKAVAPEESVHDGLRSLRFEEKSIPDTAIEQFAPADYSTFRVMQFSEFSGWNDVVSWANDLFQVNDVADDEFQKVVEKLRDLPGNEQRVAAALEFVQSEIRYFSVALGESSHRPTPPNIVLQRRYGDCKDKSLLLISLLKALGIQSEPVLLDALRRKAPAKLLPSPLAFDHAIVRVDVDGKVFYLDPTRLGQHGRLDRMGQSHEGAAVLVIASGTRELVTIASPNALELTCERAVGDRHPAEARSRWIVADAADLERDVSAEVMRITREHLPASQFDKLFAESMQSRYPGAKLVGELQVDDDRVNNIVSVAVTYDVPGLATENTGNWFVRYMPINIQGALLPPPPSGRTAPFIVGGFPLEAHYTFEVKFPEEVSAVADPRSASVEDKQFTYAVTASFRGNQFKTTIDLKTLADRVETADLQKYGEDLRAANNLARGVVLVTKDEIKSLAAPDKASFAQHLRDVLQEGIDKYTKTINSGKLAANDLADAYCERSANYVSLDMMENALRDANEALKLAPNNPRAFLVPGGGIFPRRRIRQKYRRLFESDRAGGDRSRILPWPRRLRVLCGKAGRRRRRLRQGQCRGRQGIRDLYRSMADLVAAAARQAVARGACQASHRLSRRLAATGAGHAGRQYHARGHACGA